jgi:outer membrane protein assembly factor BamB
LPIVADVAQPEGRLDFGRPGGNTAAIVVRGRCGCTCCRRSTTILEKEFSLQRSIASWPRTLGVLAVWLACGWIISQTPAAEPDDWPQFRGPTGEGISSATGLPLDWSESQNVVWKTPLEGKGWSSPVSLGGQIWMTAARDDGHSLRAICVDRDSGKIEHDVEVFHIEHPVALNPKNSHASPTPVIEPGRVYVHFGTMGTACLATDSAIILWKNEELKLDHSVGPGSSPILYHDLLIVHCDGTDVQFIVALDKYTGKIAWKTNRGVQQHPDFNRRKAFCTPLVIQYHGHDQLISPAAQAIFGYDPATGRELWKIRYDGYSIVPRPVYGHGLIYFSTGFDTPKFLAVRPGDEGDLTATNIAWTHTSQAPLNPSAVLVDDAVYIVSDRGVASCLDAKTGDQRWRHRLGGDYWASPIVVEGRIYFFSENGSATVIQPGKEYKQLAVNHLDGTIMSTPAISGKAFFVRTTTDLYRIENQAKSGLKTADR